MIWSTREISLNQRADLGLRNMIHSHLNGQWSDGRTIASPITTGRNKMTGSTGPQIQQLSRFNKPSGSKLVRLGIYNYIHTPLTETATVCALHYPNRGAHQQKNMELLTFSCRRGSSGTGALLTEASPPWLEEASDISSNFRNEPTCAAARWA